MRLERRVTGILTLAAASLQIPTNAPPPPRMIGMYIHQHWPYKHPYAARTWTLDDWRGYTGGLKQLGFNTILIWPMLEIMPDPLTPSDRASLEKIARVIDMLHREQAIRVYIVLCPNIVARNAEAAKATFETRHYFYCEELVNPGEAAAVARMMSWRERLVRPLRNVDGVAIIDSDPGGYPNSPISEFVNLLGEHRKMLDRVRLGIELVYWMHAGWRGWGRMYEKGKIAFNTPAEYDETVTRLIALNPEPWGMANGLDYARKHGMADRVISFNYGRIEGEPSFPMTDFGGRKAYEGARSDAPRGVMGNAQTHCVQLPNTFAFARGAQGLPLTDADTLQFAEDLVPGLGPRVVRAWSLLAGKDPAAMRATARELGALAETHPEGGRLRGLLFGSPERFLTDLAFMLGYRAAVEDFAAAVDAGRDPKEPLRRVVEAASAWKARHGYQCNWHDARLHPALRKLNSPAIDQVLDATYEAKGAYEGGKTAFEDVRGNFAHMETFTPRLLEAMRTALDALPSR
jgi:hypothetical protein